MSLNGKEEGRRRKARRAESEDEEGVGSVVVAVDGEHKASQYALKWAVDRLLHRDTWQHTSIVLLNVRQPSNVDTSAFACGHAVVERQPDELELELLRPFRGFCGRRQIGFEIVVVEDEDVGQALVDYSIRHRVRNLLMGASSKKPGLSKLFNHHRSANARTIVKWVPDFCNVFIISHLGKLRNVRTAIPPLHPAADNILVASGRGGCKSWCEDTASERESIEFGLFPTSVASSPCQDFDIREFRFLNETSLLLTHKLELMEEDIKRLKLQHNQTPPDIYSSSPTNHLCHS